MMKKVTLPQIYPKEIRGDIIRPEYRIKVSASQQGNQQGNQQANTPSLTFQWLSPDEVEWVINNPTDQTLYTGIWRNGYIFGSAFTEVYIRNGLTKLWEDVNEVTSDQEPYRIGLVSDPYYPTLAFVFKVPPQSTLQIPEYGFSQQNPPQDYQLVPLTPGKKISVLVSYDPMLPFAYALQAGEPVLSMPSLYPLEVLTFNTNIQLQNPFVRYFYGYNILTEFVLPVLG